MTMVREFSRKKPPQPRPPARRSNLAPIAAAFGAFAVGALAVFFWDALPSFGPWPSPLKLFESASTRTHPERIGRASTAPLLKICLTPRVMNVHRDEEIDPAILLMAIEGDPRDRLPRDHTMPREHGVLDTAQIWGEVADCVYQQNSYKFCDIDNRALAVQAANTFIRQADRIIAQPQAKYAALPGEVPALATVRDRVLEGLRLRLRNGVLIKEDFEGGVPVAVARLLVDAKTVRNDCASQ